MTDKDKISDGKDNCEDLREITTFPFFEVLHTKTDYTFYTSKRAKCTISNAMHNSFATIPNNKKKKSISF